MKPSIAGTDAATAALCAVHVVPLDLAVDPASAGRKAATLARLRGLGVPTPDGVVLLADAHRAALAGPVTDLDAATAHALVEAVSRFGDVPLAVRSSGIDEDGESASFAGLYETVLDVRGPHALLAAVRHCWDSAAAGRVARYHGTAPDGVAAIAVLVQPLVPAAAAGVAFTADPVSGARDVVVLEAVHGLADRLVHGEVTPEHWRVTDRPSCVGEVPGGLVLTDRQAARVAALARQAEHLLGGPQDVEWALDGDGTVVLLQSRPVTTLAAQSRVVVPVEVPAHPPEGFWQREASHAPLPWTPVNRTWLAQRGRTLAAVSQELGLLVDGLEFRDIGGWEYQRVVPLGGKEPAALPAWATWLAVRLAPPIRARTAAARRALGTACPRRWVRRYLTEWEPDLSARTHALLAVDRARLDDAALARHVEQTLAIVLEGCDVHFRLHGALCIELSRFFFTCRDVLGYDAVAAFRLVSGTSYRSTAPGRALAGVAAVVRTRPQVLDLVLSGAPWSAISAADAQVAAALDGYLREYGCRTLQYDVAEPTLDERPELVLALLRDQLVGDADPAAQETAVHEQREQALAAARAALAARPQADRERFERDLAAATLAYPVREDNEFTTVSRPLALLHHAALAAGERLAARHRLERSEDVFMLETDELLAALADGTGQRDLDLRDLVLGRLGERAWVLAHPGPDTYGPAPAAPPLSVLPSAPRSAMEAFLWTTEQIFPPATETGQGDGPLHGVAGSPGVYTGTVRVIHDETQFERLRPGDVLVCPSTSPVWSVLFPSVGALVTDAGGALSHPAIIAREYGVPAVVATGCGTSRLRDGDLVRVDGTHGVVTVVTAAGAA